MPPLRIGLLVDGPEIAGYGLEIARRIKNADFARLALVVRAVSGREPGSWLFVRYARWDRARVSAADPLDVVDGALDLDGTSTVPADAGQSVREARLDVIVDVTRERCGDALGRAATFGVWSVRFGNRAPECFWEVVESNPLTSLDVQVRQGPEAGVVTVGRSVTATGPGLSWARNRLAPYWAGASLVIEKLRALHDRGWDAVRGRAVTPPGSEGRRPDASAPTNRDMLRWLVPSAASAAVKRLALRATKPEWRLAIRRSDRSLLERAPGDLVGGFRWLEAPVGWSRADPFLGEFAGKTWAFFEEIDAATGRGRISAAEIGSRGEMAEATPALTRPYHLSYPGVFADGGEHFMIPETSDNGTVELYRCRRFPDEWVLEKVLFHDRAVDTTVWIEDGRYWFFTTTIDPSARAAFLWLFAADSLTGPWIRHPENPISMDVRRARGAGAIFRQNGKLYRPSQDCSGRYGRTFSLNEIEALTPEHYSERPVVTVEPQPGFVGTHTYARCGDVEMIDGCALVRT